jgi:hypothetical protein
MFARSWMYTEIFRDLMQAFNDIASLFQEANTSERFRVIIAPPQPALFVVNWDVTLDPARQPVGVSMSVELAAGGM